MSANANIRAGRAYVEVTAETSKLKQNLNAAQSQLRDFGKACQGLGRDMMALGGALSLPFILAERSFAGFDDKMRLVQAVTSSTGDQFDQLTKTAQRLGRETSFTAQQVADAMIGLGRMGFNPSEIVSAIDSVLNLSRATGTDLAESADIAANSLRIFGLEAEKMSQVSDVLTATANGSAQTLTDLFEGLKMAAPQAASCGESIEETCAALGVMANMGIKGSLAGTALRKAFIQFADTKVQAMLREVGVESVDASGNLRKMAAVMRDIAVATAKMPTAERLSFMKDVFDVRGMMSGISLTANIDEMDKFLARLKDVSGAADETARAMDRGIGGSFRLFQSAVEGTMNAVGEALTETLKPMTDDVTAVINTFTKWVEANRGLVTSVAATVASVAALGGALFVLGTTSRVLGAGVGVVSKAVSGVSGLFGLLAKKGIVASNAFSLMARAFADYRNASVPALVGTSKLLAALNLPIDSRAKQIAANLVLMSNAETAAVAKSAIAAKFASFEAALKRINAATVTATVSAKLHGIALAKAAVAAKFDGMIAGIRGLTASTVAATVSAKLHGIALARTAVAAKFDGMIASLRNLNVTTVAATISAKMHTAAVAKTAVAAKFGGMLAALKGVNAATVAATVSAKLHTLAVAKTAAAAKFASMLTALKGVNAATLAATVSAKMHTVAVSKTALAAKFAGMVTALRGVNVATVAATVSAKLHTAAVAKTALAARFGSMVAALKGVNAATVTATMSANAHTVAVGRTSVAAKFGSMLAQLKGVNLATVAAAASAKLHGLALAKSAVAGKFGGLVNSLKGVNFATVAATLSAKLHGIAVAKSAAAAKFGGMISALKGVNAATLAAAVSARLHTAAVAKTALAARFEGMVASLKSVNLATVAATVSARLHAAAVARTAAFAKFEGMVASLKGVTLATAAATLSAKLHAAAVAKTALAARFGGLIAALKGVNAATVAATVSARLHSVAVAKTALAAKFGGMVAALRNVNLATAAATVSANLHSLAVARTAAAAKFGAMLAALKGVNAATVAATVSAKLHALAVAKSAVAAKFGGFLAGLRSVILATVTATSSANLHTAAVVRTSTAARYGAMVTALKGVESATAGAAGAANLHTAAVGRTATAGRFGAMAAALKGVDAATASATVSANLHTAAVARTAIAAKFSGVVAALKGLNRATIAATVSAKAHAAAETLASLAAKASTAAHTAFAAVGAVVTASHAKAALGAAAAGTANVALALTTKLVAAGYLAAASAAAAFCAIPITWVLIAVVGALVGLCAYMASATKHTAALSDEMSKLREKGDDLRATDQLRMERLQQLADKEQLNNAEMQEAEKLSNQLKSRYGALGISIDKATGSISMATDAQERFNAAMKAQALQQVEAEMAELQKNIRELGEENQSLCGFWVNAWNTITFRMDKAANDITENGKKIDEAMSKLADARKRRDAILGNEEGALTGGKTEKEQLEANVEKGRQEKGASREDAERAAKKLADIEKKLTREQRTELENEISDIRELRDEYKQLIQTVLSFEKSKKQKDLEKIADLEGRLAEADAVAERRIAAANERAKKKFDKEIADLQGDFDQTAEDVARNRKEAETDRTVDKTLKADPAAGMKLLQNLVNQARAAADQAKADFAKALADASADGKVTDEEKEKIGKAKDAYSYSEGLVDKYAAKLRSAQDETQKRAGSVKPQGAFYARAASALRGNMMEQRMYMATQEIEKHTKKTAELLKDFEGGGGTFQ